MAGRRPKVLVIGVDGARADTMEQVARRPGSALGALVRAGAWSFAARTVPITSSAPAWASALTGTTIAKHGIRDDTFAPHRLDAFPHFFTRIRRAAPARKIASIVNWAPIHAHLLPPGDADVVEEHPADARVCARAVELLRCDPDLDALFVHLDAVDRWGHRTGYASWNPCYRRAAVGADRMIGAMTAALAERRTRRDEDWLVVSLSDHGGRWFGHGGDHPSTRTVHFVVAGDGVARGRFARPPSVMDLAPTCLDHLGVAVEPGWGLDGAVLRRAARETSLDG